MSRMQYLLCAPDCCSVDDRFYYRLNRDTLSVVVVVIVAVCVAASAQPAEQRRYVYTRRFDYLHLRAAPQTSLRLNRIVFGRRRQERHF